jgi:AAA15 family ATPase/GTPase
LKITFARVKNYKSHRDSGEIAFGDRYTVIVGQNSSGKTAFLEALNPNTFKALPHRTPQKGVFPTVPNPLCEG